MPNHCYQNVTISGPRSVVHHLFLELTEHGRFCDAVIPMSLEPLLDEHGSYGWRIENWGTKWDVCEVTVVVEPEPEAEDTERHWFSFTCWTAWAPPIPVWERLRALGCRVTAYYEDEGLMFEGHWIDGDDQCWEPEIEEGEDA